MNRKSSTDTQKHKTQSIRTKLLETVQANGRNIVTAFSLWWEYVPLLWNYPE